MKRRSSLRRTGAPIPVALMVLALPAIPFPDVAPSLFGCLRGSAAAHRAGASGDRLDDVVIARAAANIAFELFTDGAVVELVAFAADNVDGRHDHAGRTEAALQSVI